MRGHCRFALDCVSYCFLCMATGVHVVRECEHNQQLHLDQHYATTTAPILPGGLVGPTFLYSWVLWWGV